MHPRTNHFGFKQKSFFLFAILFTYFTVGSNLKLDIYFYKWGIGYFDLLFILLAIISTAQNKLRFNVKLSDIIFVSFSFMVLMMILSEIFALFFQFKSNIDFSFIRKIYFLLIFIIIYHISSKSFNTYACLKGALVGTVIGGIFYFIENYNYTLKTLYVPEIAGIQLINDQNVIGQVLALSVLSLFILHVLDRKIKWCVLIILAFIPLLMTYSKTSMLQWLILLIMLISWYILYNRKMSIKVFLFATLGGIFCAIVYYLGFENLDTVYEYKLEQTRGGTVDARLVYFYKTLYASFNSPLFGHGAKNLEYITNIVPVNWAVADVSNSHNAFSELAFSSGYLAALALLVTIHASASRLRYVVLHYTSRFDSLFVFIAFYIVIGLWASVQLQIYSQPWFYAFCGLISGIARKIRISKKFSQNEE